jgi:glyoxalase family protein
MTKSAGIHHITGIAGEPRRHVAFYTRTLGLRMVKKTVNFDDPGKWHLYYGDETGSPGTALTFFIWDDTGTGYQGAGQAIETAFAIPEHSIGYWTARLADQGVAADAPQRRLGETVIELRDPNGLSLALVGAQVASALPGWSNGEIPAEHAIRGFHGVTLWVADPAPTAALIADVLGFARAASEGDRHRLVGGTGPLGTIVDLRAVPGIKLGQFGPGTLHHVAFRAANDADQRAMADRLRQLGFTPTDQKQRQYFRSVYFREPGGVIFEIATDDPGFTLDEPRETLGTALKLPPWYESRRAEIEKALPPLT